MVLDRNLKPSCHELINFQKFFLKIATTFGAFLDKDLYGAYHICEISKLSQLTLPSNPILTRSSLDKSFN